MDGVVLEAALDAALAEGVAAVQDQWNVRLQRLGVASRAGRASQFLHL